MIRTIQIKREATQEQDALTALSLRTRQQELRVESEGLLRQAESAADPATAHRFYTDVATARQQLLEVNRELKAYIAPDEHPVVLEMNAATNMKRGAEPLDPNVTIVQGLTHVPTSICHLLDTAQFALVRCTVTNRRLEGELRMRVRCWVEGYSAEAVTTLVLASRQKKPVQLLPTFFPHRLHALHELTQATLHVVLDDLSTGRIFHHATCSIWLLARNSAPLSMQLFGDRGVLEYDMRRYLAAFVTPHAPAIVRMVRNAAARHPEQMLAGYQGVVDAQVRAIFEMLRDDLHLAYVNSYVDYHHKQDTVTQRVRLPSETFREKQANCLDGALLFASLLEAISLKPGLGILPGHAIVAWRPHENQPGWCWLDTTRIATSSFEDAITFGTLAAEILGDGGGMETLDISESRLMGITPLS